MRILYIFICSLLTFSLSAQVDLELSLVQTQETPGIYTTYEVVATVSNNGSQSSTGVSVGIPKPDGIVYNGGNEFTTSQGSFNPYSSEQWNVGSLAAGQTETLTISYFLLQTEAPAVYGQVVSASGNDVDSAPGNGTPPTPNEDDESSTGDVAPPVDEFPDLLIAFFTADLSADPGAVANYEFTLFNQGDAIASGDYTIGAYLSVDDNLSSDDVFVGVINTGNTPVGQIPNIPGQITVPANQAPGVYFLILNADDENVIEETFETNNTRSVNFLVNDDVTPPTGDGCAFLTTGDLGVGAFDDFVFSESSTGYTLTSERISFQRDSKIIKIISLDLEGNVISETETTEPYSDDVIIEVDNDDNIEMVFVNTGTRVPIQLSDLPNDIQAVFGSIVVETSTGYAFVITYIGDGGSPDIHIVKTDTNGNIVRTGLSTDQAFFNSTNQISEGPGGTIYAEFQTSGNNTLYGLPGNGAPQWSFRVLSDTPSADWIATKPSKDGQYVYTFKTDNQRAFLDRVENATGTVVNIDLEPIVGSIPNGAFRRSFATGIETTDDGGVLISLSFSDIGNFPNDENGFIIGKLSTNGQTIWSTEFLDNNFFLSPAGETADGGALFFGNISTGQGNSYFVKTTSDGQLTPLCEDDTEPPTGDDCGFLNTYANPLTPVGSVGRAEETSDEFLIDFLSAGGNAETAERLNIDKNGNLNSWSNEPYEVDPPEAQPTLSFTADGANTVLSITKTNVDQTEAWSIDYDFTTATGYEDFDLYNLITPGYLKLNDGYFVYGNLFGNNGTISEQWIRFGMKVDENGNVVNVNFWDDYNSPYVLQDIVQCNQGFVIVNYNNDFGRTLELFGFDNSANRLWSYTFAGDLPSNRFHGIFPSFDNNSFFLANTNNGRSVLSNIDPVTGDGNYGGSLGDVLSPDGDFSVNQFITGWIITPDNGIIVGLSQFLVPDVGIARDVFEAGKLNADGSVDWDVLIDEDLSFVPLIETSSGGSLWGSRSFQGTEVSVMRLTADGSLIPDCSGEEVGMDLSIRTFTDNINAPRWTTFTTGMFVENNSSFPATGVQVEIPLPDGLVFSGGNEFEASQGTYSPYSSRVWDIGDLGPGESAAININFFVVGSGSIDFYAQVIAVNEDDVDSTPNNGSCCTVNEDDEGYISINGSQANERNVVLENFEKSNRNIQIQNIYPNPTHLGVVQLSLSSKDNRASVIEIYNSIGQKIQEHTIHLDKGENVLTLDIPDLKSGMYYLGIQEENLKFMPSRFVVARD